MYTVPAWQRKAGMSNWSPGPGRTEAARAGSARKERARDMTIRTVAAVLWASDRSSVRVRAHCRAPAASRIRSGAPGCAAHTQAACVEVVAQVVGGLGGPEGAVFDALLRHGKRERVGAADRGGRVLAAGH